jgi:hypothetical protein
MDARVYTDSGHNQGMVKMVPLIIDDSQDLYYKSKELA